MKHRIFILALLLLSIANSAFAKKATIRWKEVEGADSYEIQIKLDEQVIISEKLPRGSNKWEGPLVPGLYYYRIRVRDRIGREGVWSKYYPLVARPDAPEGQSSTQDVWKDKGGGVKLKWDTIPHVKEWIVVVKDKDEIAFKETSKTNELYIPAIQPGEYSWQVQAVLKAGERVPASISGMEAAGVFSQPLPLVVHSEPPRTDWHGGFMGSLGLYDLIANDIFTGIGGSEVGAAFGVSLTRYLNPKWDFTFQLTFDALNIRLANQEITYQWLPELFPHFHYYFRRIEKQSGWEAALFFGPQITEYLTFDADGSIEQTGTPGTLGVGTGFLLRRRITASTAVAFRASTYVPIVGLYSSRLSETLGSPQFGKHWALAVGLTQRLFGRVGITADFTVAHKNVSYDTLYNSVASSNVSFVRKMYFPSLKLEWHFD